MAKFDNTEIREKVKREHVLKAISYLRKNPWNPKNNSQRYDLIHEGKRYPPKEVLREAYRVVTGTRPGRFPGGEKFSNKILRKLGFEKEIMERSVNKTTQKALTDARVGQGEFRKQVLKNWGSQCCVTGSRTLDAIRASHIKPWRESNNKERLDPYNGLPLIATLDALFDEGLITFSPDGKLLVSKKLDANEKKLLGLDGRRLRRLPDNRTADYLACHRKSVFRDR